MENEEEFKEIDEEDDEDENLQESTDLEEIANQPIPRINVTPFLEESETGADQPQFQRLETALANISGQQTDDTNDESTNTDYSGNQSYISTDYTSSGGEYSLAENKPQENQPISREFGISGNPFQTREQQFSQQDESQTQGQRSDYSEKKKRL